jgi:hypothetical protein
MVAISVAFEESSNQASALTYSGEMMTREAGDKRTCDCAPVYSRAAHLRTMMISIRKLEKGEAEHVISTSIFSWYL